MKIEVHLNLNDTFMLGNEDTAKQLIKKAHEQLDSIFKCQEGYIQQEVVYVSQV